MRRWIIGLLCAASVLAVGGCSFVRVGYNQAHELSYWWLDRHVEFDAAQSPRVRDALGQWFVWHRREQLPDYLRLLARAQAEVQAPMTAAQVCAWYDEGRSRARVAFDHALPSIADLAASLTPRQIENIERRHAKVNAEYREDVLLADPAKRRKAAQKRGLDRAEMLYGKLDPAQRERLGEALTQSPYDPERSFAQRRRSQQDAVQILRQAAGRDAGPKATQDALAAYALALQQPADAQARRYRDEVTQYNCALVAGVHNGTTPEQRRHAADKLADWSGDLRYLVAEARR